MALHLRPVPDANVVPFPNTAAENREAVIAQLSNIQAALIARNGVQNGRMMFAEAAVAVIARTAAQERSSVATLFALVHEFEISAGLPGPTNFEGIGDGFASGDGPIVA